MNLYIFHVFVAFFGNSLGIHVSKNTRFVPDESIQDIHVMDGRISLDAFKNDHYDCFVECAVRPACVTIGYFKPTAHCDLYTRGMTGYTRNVVQQPNTTFYKAVCSNSEYTHVRTLGLCLNVNAHTLTKPDALTACETDGGRLLSVDTEAKMSYISAVLAHLHSQDTPYVLNAEYDTNGGTWGWNTENGYVPLTSTTGNLSWAVEEPKSGHCMAIMSLSGNFVTVDCSSMSRFVCVKEED